MKPFDLRQLSKAHEVRFSVDAETEEKLPWPQFTVADLNFFYGAHQALKGINLIVPNKRVMAFIGPSGCGKTTLLRTFNRMNEIIPGTRVEGSIRLGDKDLFSFPATTLRRVVGMVFQKPSPFPKSIFDNVAYGLRLDPAIRRSEIADKVEQSLRRAALWDEVKDKLHQSANGISGGQQQRLCIARALAVEPEVLLLDEPCSALDPLSTAKIEDLLFEIKDLCTIVIVTHNMLQAARVADYVGFFLNGELIELNRAKQIFQNPEMQQTQDYITGRFG
ncbi:MAG TPA: phosphate ABC transporter ATP-binding protein PstB [Acidobacteriaceae bacterium]|nr:phosphate ABC transporter ATP-binding protein PstB [Terriglobia bacterium]HVC89638.1 phosphate ABC transporter ATP-binding protein PstB [Acidobacteriaceae bacterium]